MGLGNNAFTYQVVQYGVSIGAVIVAQVLYDYLGRRPILIVGTLLQTLFMLLVAGLGTKGNKSSSDVQGVVWGIILFYPTSRMGLGNCTHLITAEMGGIDLRKKLMVSTPFLPLLGG